MKSLLFEKIYNSRRVSIYIHYEIIQTIIYDISINMKYKYTKIHIITY